MSQLAATTVGFSANFFSMLLVAVFLENLVFSRALGTSTVLAAARQKHGSLLLGGIVTGFTLLSTFAAYWLTPLLAGVAGAALIRPLVYVAVIGVMYLLGLAVACRLPAAWRKSVCPLVHIAAFNCAVFGGMLLALSAPGGLLGALGFALGSGIGFTAAVALLAAWQERLNSRQLPRPFRGLPAAMLFIGVLSLACYGLIGHQLPV